MPTIEKAEVTSAAGRFRRSSSSSRSLQWMPLMTTPVPLNGGGSSARPEVASSRRLLTSYRRLLARSATMMEFGQPTERGRQRPVRDRRGSAGQLRLLANFRLSYSMTAIGNPATTTAKFVRSDGKLKSERLVVDECLEVTGCTNRAAAAALCFSDNRQSKLVSAPKRHYCSLDCSSTESSSVESATAVSLSNPPRLEATQTPPSSVVLSTSATSEGLQASSQTRPSEAGTDSSHLTSRPNPVSPSLIPSTSSPITTGIRRVSSEPVTSSQQHFRSCACHAQTRGGRTPEIGTTAGSDVIAVPGVASRSSCSYYNQRTRLKLWNGARYRRYSNYDNNVNATDNKPTLYVDPLRQAPGVFLDRIGQLTALTNDTVRLERLQAASRRTNNTNNGRVVATSTSSIAKKPTSTSTLVSSAAAPSSGDSNSVELFDKI